MAQGKVMGVLTGSRRWIEVEDLCYGEAKRGHMTVVRSLSQLHWREVLACLLALVKDVLQPKRDVVEMHAAEPL